MRKQFTEIGNSLGFIIPSEIKTLLNLTKETEVDISTNGSNKIFIDIIREGQKPITLDIAINLTINVETKPP